HRRHRAVFEPPQYCARREKRMKPLFRVLGGAAVAIAIATTSSLALAQESKGKIYYLVPTLLDEFQTGSIDAITKFMKDVGYEVVALDGQNQTNTQMNQLDDQIKLKPAAMIIAAVDFDAIKPGSEQARADGNP